MLNENNNTNVSQLTKDFSGAELLTKLKDYNNELKFHVSDNNLIDVSSKGSLEKINCIREIYSVEEGINRQNNIEAKFDSENTFIVYNDIPIRVSELEKHCDHEKIENVKIDEAISRSVSVPVEMHKKMIGENHDPYMSVKDVLRCLDNPNLFLDTKEVSDISDLNSLIEEYKNSKVRDMIDGDRDDPYLNLGKSEQKIVRLFGKVEWEEISNRLQIPEKYYKQNADNMNWSVISKNQKFEVEFIKKYADRIDFAELSKNPFITKEIIHEFADRLVPKEILENPKVDDEIKKDINEKGYIDGKCSVVDAAENNNDPENISKDDKADNDDGNVDTDDSSDIATDNIIKDNIQDVSQNDADDKAQDMPKNNSDVKIEDNSNKADEKNVSPKLKALNQKIKELEAKVESLEKKVEALEEKRDALEKENSELKEKIDILIEKNNDKIAKDKLTDFETRLEDGTLTPEEAKEFIMGDELLSAKDIDTLVDKKLVGVNDIVEHQQVSESFFKNHKGEIDVELFKKHQDDGSFSDEFKEEFKEYFEDGNNNDDPEHDEDPNEDLEKEDNDFNGDQKEDDDTSDDTSVDGTQEY